jgi:dihydroorotate dehydrogenase (fumarate)
MAELLQQFPISFVTCINSLGNGLIIDTETERPVIRPKCGLGGIGGDVIRPFALSNVYQFRKALPDRIDVIGCGGISSGEWAFQHILVGATAVQIGSTYMREGTKCFKRIATDLQDIMIHKGYNTLDDFRGILKEMD